MKSEIKFDNDLIDPLQCNMLANLITNLANKSTKYDNFIPIPQVKILEPQLECDSDLFFCNKNNNNPLKEGYMDIDKNIVQNIIALPPILYILPPDFFPQNKFPDNFNNKYRIFAATFCKLLIKIFAEKA